MAEVRSASSPKTGVLGRIPGWVWALALYVGIVLWRFRDVLRAPSRLLVGAAGDNFNYLWRIWWFAGGFRQWGGDMFFAPQIMYPLGHHLAEAELTPLNLVPAVALAHLFGPVLAYNAVLLTDIVLAGLVTYFFARRLSASRLAATLAGVVYAFGAYPMVHSVGHLPLMGLWTLPLGLLAIEALADAVTRGDAVHSRWWAVGLGVSLGLSGWSSWYYLVMFGLTFATYGLVRLSPSRTGRVRRPWALFGVALLVGLAMVVPLYLLVRTHVGGVSMKWTLKDIWGAPFFAYFVPGMLNPLVGSWSAKILGHTPGEDSLYVGAVALALAVVGVVASRKASRSVGPLLWSAGVAFVFSLGPRLYLGVWDNPKLGFALPSRILGRRILSMHKPSIPLPAVLGTRLPVFDAMRQYDRFGVIVLLCVAALCAIGFDVIRKKLDGRGRVLVAILFVGLLAFTLFETSSLVPSVDTSPKPVEAWLAQQTGPGAVVWLPDWAGVEDEQIYKTSATNKPIAFGGSTFVPVEVQRLGRLVRTDFPSKQAIEVLDASGVRWIVWQKAQGPTPVVPGSYRLAASFPDVDVLERIKTP